MILLIDNYDSFTYNLVQYLQVLGARVEVRRNDRIGVDEIEDLSPEGIVISPGPGRPEKAGICLDVISTYSGRIPILGVCLGHQAIGMAFGAKVTRAKSIVHGKTSIIEHDGKGIFHGIKNHFTATRYHSLIVEAKSLTPCLEISSWSEDREVMGIRHKSFLVEGVQFHPESILTENGKDLLKNFLLMSLQIRKEKKGGKISDTTGHQETRG